MSQRINKYKNKICECGNIADIYDNGVNYICKRCYDANLLASSELKRFISWQRADNERVKLTQNFRRWKAKQKAQETL